MSVNPELIRIAAATVGRQKRAAQKTAFQPPQDPSAGGGPPMDPSAGGPPPDAGGGGPGLDMVLQKLDQLTQAIAGGGGMGGAPGAAPGMAGPGAGKASKQQEQSAQLTDLFQIKKVMFAIANAMGVEIPPEVMDGPNRDPATGVPLPPGTPGSTSDPNVMAQQGGGGGSPPGGAGDAGGGQGAIPPIQPIQPAMPSPGGAPKTAGAMGQPYNGGLNRVGADVPPVGRSTQDKAAALAALLRSRKTD